MLSLALGVSFIVVALRLLHQTAKLYFKNGYEFAESLNIGGLAAPAAAYGQSFLLKFTNLCKILY